MEQTNNEIIEKAKNKFVKHLCKSRQSGDLLVPVYELFSALEVKKTITGESAKAFLIHAALSALSIGDESDTVLCSLQLLAGYNQLDFVTNRRVKLMEAREAQRKRMELPPPEKKYKRSTQERSKDLIRIEKGYYYQIANYILSPDAKPLKTYMEEAEVTYLAPKLTDPKTLCVRLPRPSYLNEGPISVYNLPLKNNRFMGRRNIITKLQRSFKNGKHMQIIYGMGGVGKTEIALHYAQTHKKEYGAVVWMNAVDIGSLLGSCREILIKLDYDVTNMTDEAIRLEFVKQFERSADWLIVYDNVDYLSRITDEDRDLTEVFAGFIPQSDGDIIITTRCDVDYNGIPRIQVDVFTEEDSIKYLVLKSGRKENEDTVTLAKRIGGLALALEYAASYIKINKITYANYLRLWDENEIKVFDKEGYAKTTVRKAFLITLDKLKNDPVITEMLRVFSHMKYAELPLNGYIQAAGFFWSHDHFDCDKLWPILNNELEKNELLRILSNYSLISWDGIHLSIHPLLKEVVLDEMPPSASEDRFNCLRYDPPIELLRDAYECIGDVRSALYYHQKVVDQYVFSAEDVKKKVARKVKEIKADEETKPFYVLDMIKFLSELACTAIFNPETAERFVLNRRESMRCLYENTEYIYDVEDLRYEERRLYNRISKTIDRDALYRCYHTPEEQKQTGKQYYVGRTRREDYCGYRVSRFVIDAVIDIWLNDIDDAETLDKRIQELTDDESSEWWVIALPPTEE